MSKFDQLANKILNEAATTREALFQYIHDNVEELRHIWTQDFENVYGKRIWEAYLDECRTRRKNLSPEQFVEDIYNSIGWDWVLTK